MEKISVTSKTVDEMEEGARPCCYVCKREKGAMSFTMVKEGEKDVPDEKIIELQPIMRQVYFDGKICQVFYLLCVECNILLSGLFGKEDDPRIEVE